MEATGGTPGAAEALPGPGLSEAQRLHWRKPATERALRRDERRWTRWTATIVTTFTVPSLVLLWLEPLMLPFAAIWSAHGYAICRMQAGRGAKSVVAIGSARSAAKVGQKANPGAEGVALGLLGDLLGHEERELLKATGLALYRGNLGVWLVGEQGALLVRPKGHRVDSWCVRVADQADLPAGDRVAHLLLAVREDEVGFATVANLGFSGARSRTRARMDAAQRPALEAARQLVKA